VKKKLGQIVAAFDQLRKSNEEKAKNKWKKMNEKSNSRDENGVMIYNSNAKRTDGHRDSDGNRIGRAGEILEEGLIYDHKIDRYRARVWKNGVDYQGPYQVVIEKARADLRLYRKKFTLPNPLALVGPLAQTEGPSGPFPEKWMHGASDFIKALRLCL